MKNEAAKKLIDEAAVQAPHEIPMMLGISVALADLDTTLYLMNEIAPKMTEEIQREMHEHALIAAGALLKAMTGAFEVPEGTPVH